MSLRTWSQSLAGTAPQPDRRALSYQSVWGSGGDWHDGIATAKTVSVETALGLPALLSCVDTIAGQISSYPLQTFRQTGTIRERIADGQLVTNPSTMWAGDEWVYVAVASMLLHGDAVGFITKATTDRVPIEIEWVDPRNILISMVDGRRRYDVNGEIIPTDRIFHIRHGVLLPGAVRGRSPISFLAAPIRSGLEAITFELGWFQGGAHPSGILNVDVPDLDQVVADTLVQRFLEKTKARKPVALSKTVSYQQIQSTPEAAGLDAARQRVASDIANVFHIPPEMVGGTVGSLTYKTLETDQAALDVRALMPVYARLERAISRLLPEGTYVRFNADTGVRTDLRTRAEVGEILIRSGQRTVDEVRAKDDMAPLVAAPDAEIVRMDPRATADTLSVELQWMTVNEVREVQGLAPVDGGDGVGPMTASGVTQRDAGDVAKLIQQMYLGVGTVVTADEVREILNQFGAGLVVPAPDEAKSKLGATIDL